VRVLGEIRAATITYRAIARSHLLATTAPGKDAQEVLLKKWIDNVENAHKRYEPMINSDEERAFYNESKAAWNEYLDGVKQLVVQPATQLAHDAVSQTNWTLVVLVTMLVISAWLGIRWSWSARRSRPVSP
jgi:methyl-accepting chemotaxis protein